MAVPRIKLERSTSVATARLCLHQGTMSNAMRGFDVPFARFDILLDFLPNKQY